MIINIIIIISYIIITLPQPQSRNETWYLTQLLSSDILLDILPFHNKILGGASKVCQKSQIWSWKVLHELYCWKIKLRERNTEKTQVLFRERNCACVIKSHLRKKNTTFLNFTHVLTINLILSGQGYNQHSWSMTCAGWDKAWLLTPFQATLSTQSNTPPTLQTNPICWWQGYQTSCKFVHYDHWGGTLSK